ncbi:MAG: hypothetical protein U0Q16_36425 [Bryobacteraceae bacterium]
MEKEIIRFRPWRLARVAAPLVALIALSLVVNFDAWRTASPWTLAGLGAVFALLAVAGVAMRTRYYVELDASGVQLHYLGGVRSARWQDIESIDVARRSVNDVSIGDTLIIKLKPEAASSARNLLAGVIGYHMSIYGVLEQDCPALANTLERWRRRYGGGSSQPHTEL